MALEYTKENNELEWLNYLQMCGMNFIQSKNEFKQKCITNFRSNSFSRTCDSYKTKYEENQFEFYSVYST